MPTLQTLRETRAIVRWMLVWFALSLGVAVASPAVNPQGWTLVCSAAGAVQLKLTGDDGAPQAAAHTLDCVLCMVAGAPPQTGSVLAALPALVHAQPAALAQRPVGRVVAAAAARGPPALA